MELSLLGSGAWQHVFIPADETEPEWVYKLPAAYGYILPLRPRLNSFCPSSATRKSALSLLKAPDRLADRLHGWSESRRRPAVLRAAAALGEGIAQAICIARDGCLAVVLKRSRRRRFDEMARQLGYLTRHGMEDVLLPYRVLSQLDATLLVNGSRIPYRGPALVQRKADFFRGGSLDFASFRWCELVNAQQRLWRFGMAFSEVNQILGPMNWGLLDGRLRLADTSNLTTDYRTARRLLDPGMLDAKEAVVMERLSAPATPEVAAEYFRFVRREINARRLEELWRADVDNGERGSSRPTAVTDGGFGPDKVRR